MASEFLRGGLWHPELIEIMRDQCVPSYRAVTGADMPDRVTLLRWLSSQVTPVVACRSCDCR